MVRRLEELDSNYKVSVLNLASIENGSEAMEIGVTPGTPVDMSTNQPISPINTQNTENSTSPKSQENSKQFQGPKLNFVKTNKFSYTSPETAYNLNESHFQKQSEKIEALEKKLQGLNESYNPDKDPSLLIEPSSPEVQLESKNSPTDERMLSGNHSQAPSTSNKYSFQNSG